MKKKDYSIPVSKIVSIQPMVMIAASPFPSVNPGTNTGDSFVREYEQWKNWEDEDFCLELFDY